MSSNATGSSESAGSGEPFNVSKLKELMELMDQYGLSEIDLRSGEQRWHLRRGAEVVQTIASGPFAGGPYAVPQYAAPPAAAPAPATASAPAASAAPPVADGVVIKSPTVGTYYSAAAPGEDPFVSVGSKVTKETVVCIIEAMKVFNQINAEVNGTITEVLAKSGDPVEFGQPLFRVRLG